MAWGRKKSGTRKEPQFGLGASLASLRLSVEDRIPSSEPKPKKAAPKRKPEEPDDEEPPRERKQASTMSNKRRNKARGITLSRLLYWGVVCGLWAGIVVIGAVVWAGAHLPPIQSLEIPKRPPTIEIVGIDGGVLAERGEMAGANVAL